MAIGAAITKKLNNDKNLVYCLTGDGELNEGQIWEALLFAAHHNVDNLIVNVDVNGQQIDGPTNKVLDTRSLKEKFEAFNWTVLETNGNVLSSLKKTMLEAISLSGKKKPIAVLMKTEMGKGVSFMEGTHEWHGKAPNKEQYELALSELPVTLEDY